MSVDKQVDSGVAAEPVTSEKAQLKAAQKAAAKAEKDAKKAAREAELRKQQEAANAILERVVENVEEDAYGFLPLVQSKYRTKRQWLAVDDLNAELKGQKVWLRGRVQDNRCKGSIGFIVLRDRCATVQCVLTDDKAMIKWAGSLSLESVVDVCGEVTVPAQPILGATQQVEIAVGQIHCVSKSRPELPFQLKDANNREAQEGESEEAGAASPTDIIRVSQDTRLDNRVIDLRTYAMQAVMRISSETCFLFREALRAKSFVEIHSPKLIAGASEGGSNVFTLNYFNRPACLAQSPQLYKQMAICADLNRVFEITPVFRAENSNTHRHLCEFTGLDFEMAIYEHYTEVLEMIEYLFKFIFTGLNQRCAKEIGVVMKQYPCDPLVWKEESLRLDFAEGCRMLREAGHAGIPEDLSNFDIGTEQEKALGKLVKAKYNTDFYSMYNYPKNVRPFYTMPNAEDENTSNSFDVFIRGEEIISGAQRVHDADYLTKRAIECGIDPATIAAYIDAFSYGAFPHGGCGIGMERVVMLFLGLNNIRKVSMFPRDPKRLTP